MEVIISTFAAQTFAALMVALLPVSLKTHSGDTFKGELLSIEAGEIQLDVDGQPRTLPVEEVDFLQPQSPRAGTAPPQQVTLTGGSRIAAESVVLKEEALTLKPRRQPSLTVPVKQVKAIRFRNAGRAIDPQWLGIVGGDARGDILVIRRGEDRIDPQTGIVEGIADDKVMFNLDGDTVAAPIDRLEGVVFGGTDPIAENANVRLTDIYGSRWLTSKIELDERQESVILRLSDSLAHEIPLAQIESIRWSGSLIMLASQQPVRNTVAPAVPIEVDPQLVKALFAAHAAGDGDLVLHGGAEVEYRIEPGYETLIGAVERIDAVRRTGKLNVQIQLDDERAWQSELADHGRRGFEVPLGEARRVTIRIDSAGDGDLGESIRVVRPRLTK